MLSAFSLFFCWLRPSWQRTIRPVGMMHDLHRGIGRVHALAAGSAGAANFDAQILRLQFEIDFLGFRQARRRSRWKCECDPALRSPGTRCTRWTPLS